MVASLQTGKLLNIEHESEVQRTAYTLHGVILLEMLKVDKIHLRRLGWAIKNIPTWGLGRENLKSLSGWASKTFEKNLFFLPAHPSRYLMTTPLVLKTELCDFLQIFLRV